MERTNEVKTDVRVFIALLALLAITVAASRINLGPFNFAVALSIGALKAVLIVLYFMRLKRSSQLNWIYAVIGVVWLLIALLLSMSDYLTRKVIWTLG